MGPTSRTVELGEQAVLCEATLWLYWTHRGDLVALNASSLLSLHVVDIEGLVHRYPAVRTWGAAHAVYFRTAVEISPNATDLFDTEEAFGLTSSSNKPDGGAMKRGCSNLSNLSQDY